MEINNKKPLEIYFDYISPYPYFLNEFILKNDIENKYALTLEWIPIFLGSLWPDAGNMPPNAVDARKVRYSGFETQRYAQELRVPYQPNFFKPIVVLRAALAAKRQGLFKEFHTEIYRQLQGQGAEANETLFASVIKKFGGNAEQLLQDCTCAEVKQELIANAERAKANQVFGTPWVIYNQEPYWGYNHFSYLLKKLDLEAK